MRGISVLAGLAATAFLAPTAWSASATSLVAECDRIAPPGDVCVLGRVMDDHNLVVLVTTRDLPSDRTAVWASKASENYRPIPALARYAGRLVLISGDLSNGALFGGRLLMVPTYTHRYSH